MIYRPIYEIQFFSRQVFLLHISGEGLEKLYVSGTLLNRQKLDNEKLNKNDYRRKV